MKSSVITLAFLLLTAGAATAQEQPRDPDYSRDNLMRIFSVDLEAPEHEPPVRFRAGAVEFTALGTEWRFAYLPIMAPLPGARPTTSREWPDAFSVLGTPYATPRRSWQTQRQFNSELRRINDLERRAKLKVNQ